MRIPALVLSALRLFLAGLFVIGPVRAESPTWRRVEALRADDTYRDAPAARRAEVRRLFTDLLRSAPSGILPADYAERARQVGLRPTERDGLLLLSPEQGTADGFYAIRLGPDAPPLLIQAPHAWYDLRSGELACTLFDEGHGRALFTNNAHRHSASQEDISGSDGTMGADLAHRPASIFQAATIGAADGLHVPLLVQLHGFGSAHGNWSAVLSGGAALQPPGTVEGAIRALEPVLGRIGRLTDGEAVPALAALENVQSQALAGQASFLHLELSLAARTTLLQNQALRTQLGLALSDLAERAP